MATEPAPSNFSSRALRTTLAVGFGGMLLVFLVAAADSIRLLRHMRVENQVLRQASLERSRRLAAVRSYILLSHNYIRDYLMDLDPPRSQEDLSELKDVWSRMLGDLAGYRPSTLAETELCQRLNSLLEQHWRDVNRALTSPADDRRRRAAAFFGNELAPMRTAVVEITTQVDDVNARQLAAAEAEIQEQFEHLGGRLSIALMTSLCTALLLATGCFWYILHIERQNNLRYQEIVEGRGALEQLSARLVNAQETERRALSRELHDEVGQTLGALLVDAGNLANRIPADDSIGRKYLDNIRALADSSVNSIRNIALLLRPSMLDDLGLVPALEWQAREVSRRHNVKVKVVAEDVSDTLPDAIRTCIYRIVQEALNNVWRHSGASSAVVRVRQDSISVELTVEDDGRGFDPERERGLGLLGIEERVKPLGGTVKIQSEPGKGTVLSVILPVE